ncbi:MAG: peptidase, partial [Myxococcaceae bacterium]|nr:peptidase [Myxococcaceae bacterium]
MVASLALALSVPACSDDSPRSSESGDAQVKQTGDSGSHGEFPPVYADAGAQDASKPLPQPVTSALIRAADPSTDHVSALGASNRAFAFDLYHQLALVSDGQNLLFSPLSISTALAMTYAGASGTTASEMKSALHFDLPQAQLHEAFNATDLALASRGRGLVGADGTPFRINVNNALWSQSNAQYPVVPSFLDTLALDYGAGLFQLDFEHAPEAARGSINGWVAEKTEQLIPELLPAASVDSLTRFVLTNTVY